eukprot:COSAG06_NODE_1309_length_9914_cov_2.941722_9_plen_340_part_00
MDAAALQRFAHDGFAVLRGAVPLEMVQAARRSVNASLGSEGMRNDSPDRTSSGNTRVRGHFDSVGAAPVITDLLSAVQPTLETALGASIQPVRSGQIRLCWPALGVDPEIVDIDMGVANSAIPFNGWNGHVDGFWNAVYGQNAASGKGRASLPPLPGEEIRDFSCLVAIPLSDQLEPDIGNLSLLRGGHSMLAAGFRAQRDAGGPLGPGGPGWDRFNANGGLELYHPLVRQLAERGTVATVGGDVGRRWPEPTQLLMAAGDAVLVHWATLHAAVRNLGPDVRYMCIFRVSREDHVSGREESLCDELAGWDGVRAALDAGVGGDIRSRGGGSGVGAAAKL